MLYNLLVVLIILCSGELFLRYYLNHPQKAPDWLLPSLKTYYSQLDRSILQFEPNCTQFSEDLFYELRPGKFRFSNREFDNEYLVNSAGCRDDESSLQYPKIIALGDSYTMGWGVEQNETFPEIVEKELGLKTLNMGVSSYGTAREVHALKKVKMDSVQFILMQYCPNDYNENKQFYIAEDSLVTSSKERWNQSVDQNTENTSYYPFKHLLSVIPLLRSKEESKQEGKAWKAKHKVPQISEERAFLNVLKHSTSIPANVSIILFSIEAEHCHSAFIDAVAKLLEKEHGSTLHDQISFLDLTGSITAKERYILDPHLNNKGHEAVAKKIITHLKNLPQKNNKEYWYYPDGQLGYVCEYKNGLKDGVFKSYWDNGNISRIGYFKHGKKHGEELNYHEEGWLYEKKNYVEDKLSGLHINYDKFGNSLDTIVH